MAEMMVRFDVEAYRIDPWRDNRVFTPEEYEENKRVWRGHAEGFLRAAKRRGGRVYLDVCVSEDDEPDEPGELAEIEGWDMDGCELSWHCELTIGGD